MKLTKKQTMALADARCEVNRSGLQRSGRKWLTDRNHADSHDHRTVQSLVDLGYLQFYVKGTVAHITDLGLSALS
jgi:hypothetical protein